MYCAHFGFQQRPFDLTPNTALFHALTPHIEAIQTVLMALSMREGLIKVTGEVGTGKTMVCRVLMQQLDAQYQLIYLPNPSLDGAGMCEAVLQELARPVPEQRHRLIDAIQQALLQIKAEGRHAVMVIDEAQGLSDGVLELIRLFGNLETEQEKLLSIVLLGQPELDERLANHQLRQLRQRISFYATLRPLSLAEAFAYIQYRNQSVGGRPEQFSDSAKRAIYHASRGVPRLIHQICHKALLLAYSKGKQKVCRRHVVAAAKATLDASQPVLPWLGALGWNKA
ncbi:hypothetical protein VST7929_02410 [Vibrio stylophorae]|uniref:ORC1/DEAH AAA+ ATPase domain-containing protein n=1 Tax=Vibrio stylophorae TaxID=659351 RepID=A0ABN8DYN0_9VIBR|nr:AAA family ATPase [Vibrio stylophorae]CAH0534477.1 hypothetical protein VST7929_02410 [Vibrio stylophorae]